MTTEGQSVCAWILEHPGAVQAISLSQHAQAYQEGMGGVDRHRAVWADPKGHPEVVSTRLCREAETHEQVIRSAPRSRRTDPRTMD